MAFFSSLQRKLGKISPASALANKYSPATKDLLSITAPEKADAPLNLPVTVAGKLAAKKAAGESLLPVRRRASSLLRQGLIGEDTP